MECQKAISPDALKSMIDNNETPWDKTLTVILDRFSPHWSYIRKPRYSRYWESVVEIPATPNFERECPIAVVPASEILNETDVLIARENLENGLSVCFEIPRSHWTPGDVQIESFWKTEVWLKFISPEVVRKRRGTWDDYPLAFRNRLKRLSDRSRPENTGDTSWSDFERWVAGEGYQRIADSRTVTLMAVRGGIQRILSKMERREKCIPKRSADSVPIPT